MATVLQIAELGNFKCLMGDCPDTCCKGWEIPIDSKTLTLWNSDPISRKLTQHLNILSNDNSPNPCSAKIKLDGNKNCSFLSETKLCSIHASLGEKFLSHTCRNYPRETNKFWGMFERTMALSCPEVSNSIFSQTEPLRLDYMEESEDHWIFREIAEPSLQFSPEIIVKLYEIRTLCLLKTQDRTLTIAQRLEVLSKVANCANMDTSELSKSSDLIQTEYFELIKETLRSPSENGINWDLNANSLVALFKRYIDSSNYLYPTLNASITQISEVGNEIILEHLLFVLSLRSLFPFSSTNPINNFNEIKNTVCLINCLLNISSHLNKGTQTNLNDRISLIQKSMKAIDHFEKLKNELGLRK